VAPTQAATNRKLLGAWYTPPELVDVVVDNVVATFRPARGRPVHVLDPACGDGRFLFAVAERLAERGLAAELTGCDIDGVVLGAINGPVRTIEDDALAHDWGDETFDIVVGNPPFLSQMAASTSRGGASRHGGGPYADAAVEFLALAVRLARPDVGRSKSSSSLSVVLLPAPFGPSSPNTPPAGISNDNASSARCGRGRQNPTRKSLVSRSTRATADTAS